MKKLTAYLALFLPFLAKASPIEVHSKAPVQTVVIETGETLNLADIYPQGAVLIYFYPKADTPGCTAQACNLRDSFEELLDNGLIVIGVSTDSVASQKAFKEKYHLPFHLVADSEKKLAEGFGVDTHFGFAKRQSFLVINGIVAWRDLSANPGTQAADALEALSHWK